MPEGLSEAVEEKENILRQSACMQHPATIKPQAHGLLPVCEHVRVLICVRSRPASHLTLSKVAGRRHPPAVPGFEDMTDVTPLRLYAVTPQTKLLAGSPRKTASSL